MSEDNRAQSSHYAEDMSWGEFMSCILGIALAVLLWCMVKGVSIFSRIGGNTWFGTLCFLIGGYLTIFGLLYYFSGLFVRKIHLGASFHAFIETFSATFALFDIVLQIYNNQIPA